jgi:hypothetical protein
MIKVYAGIASVGFLVALTTGCSSADTPDTGTGGQATAGTPSSSGGSGGSGVVPMGGTPSTTGGSPAGGTPAAGSGGAAPTGGAATAGAGGGGVAGPECKSIKTNMACTAEGVSCPNLACGLADSGTRNCNCATTWMCTACDFTNSPFKTKPADAPNCTAGVEADKVACTGKEGQVCLNAAGGEVCACWPDDEGALIWDCDKPPSSWAAAATQ